MSSSNLMNAQLAKKKKASTGFFVSLGAKKYVECFPIIYVMRALEGEQKFLLPIHIEGDGLIIYRDE